MARLRWTAPLPLPPDVKTLDTNAVVTLAEMFSRRATSLQGMFSLRQRSTASALCTVTRKTGVYGGETPPVLLLRRRLRRDGGFGHGGQQDVLVATVDGLSCIPGEVQIECGDAFDFTIAEFRNWCREAGFSGFETIPLDGPSSAAVADKDPR